MEGRRGTLPGESLGDVPCKGRQHWDHAEGAHAVQDPMLGEGGRVEGEVVGVALRWEALTTPPSTQSPQGLVKSPKASQIPPSLAQDYVALSNSAPFPSPSFYL